MTNIYLISKVYAALHVCRFIRMNASNSICVHSSAPEGQVLELHLLQVHIYLWRIERADSGGGGHVVFVVLCPGLSPSHGAALQRPI